MKKYLILFFVLLPALGFSQPPNCNVYLYNKDTVQYEVCKSIENVPFYQYTKEFQEEFDKAIKKCPHFAFGYQAKATAYLKSGDFLTWKYLIDKAVEYDTLPYIGYRGWCKYQFFRDYEGAIKDIEFAEKRFGILNAGYSAAGDYHLTMAKAMCYSALGDKQKAIRIMENLFTVTDYVVGLFDYYQLAVTYFQVNDLNNATKYLDKQTAINDLAENRFYKAKIAKINGNSASFEKEKSEAIRLYNTQKILFDPYTEHLNKVYLNTIAQEQYAN